MIELRIGHLKALAMTAGQPNIGYDACADEKAEDQCNPGAAAHSGPWPTGNGDCDHCPARVTDLERAGPVRTSTEGGARQRFNRHGAKARPMKIGQLRCIGVCTRRVEIEIEPCCLCRAKNCLDQHVGLEHRQYITSQIKSTFLYRFVRDARWIHR